MILYHTLCHLHSVYLTNFVSVQTILFMLEKELEKYAQVKAELQSKYPDGGFVVIKDTEVLGIWQTRVDALRAGIEKYGNVSFLVKDIRDSNIVANFSRNLKLV